MIVTPLLYLVVSYTCGQDTTDTTVVTDATTGAPTTAGRMTCEDFQSGVCPLAEDNIVGMDRFSDTPQDCQDLCREFAHMDCNYFSHFNTECYLLSSCDTVEDCEGCISGPVDPLLADCLTTTVATETTTMVISTTQPETTTMAETTTMVETTTVPETTIPKCDVNDGVLCDGHGNLIEEIEGISSASDCQAVCQNHEECNYWSHYVEEGPEKWGYCQLHYDCSTTTDAECYPAGAHECQGNTQEVFGELINAAPGDWKCHCQSGARTPDLDECDDGTTHDPSYCNDQFLPGHLCEGAGSHENGNVIEHIEHISEPSDCQSICQNHPECTYFSHYLEEGGEHWGHCFLHYNCDSLADKDCEMLARPGCPPLAPALLSFFDQFEEDHNVDKDPRPGGKHCHCIAGPVYPDMDDCSSPEFF